MELLEEKLHIGDGYDSWPEKALGGAWKRAFDLVGASVILFLTIPLFLAIALAIKMSGPGSVLYAHTRVGLGGRPFPCLKFRSMVPDGDRVLAAYLATHPEAAAEWAEKRKLTHDPRITGIGNLLRKSSLDELPQVINVLRGEMSLVGPRPVVRDELTRYDLQLVHYLRSRPGITGLWQVSGRSDTTYEQRVRFDKNYALQWSPLQDLAILLRTIPALIERRGAV